MDTTKIIEVANKISATSSTEHNFNIWMYIAIAEFVLIVFLILRKLCVKKSANFDSIKKKALSEEVDFGNFFASSFHAKELYDTLKKKCHPDRFTDENLNSIANELSQEISKNKTNLKRLEELKLKAIEKLNINL